MITENDIELIAELADIGISKVDVPEFTIQFYAFLEFLAGLDTVVC